MSSPKVTTDQWLAAAKYRRTVYGLKDTSPVPDSRIEEIVREVISFAPSSYNTQPGRYTLVLGEKHKQLWDVVVENAAPVLKAAGPHVWAAMEPRFQRFNNAYGSLVFWTRGQSLQESKETHKSAAHLIDSFADHSGGMAQILLWTALELEGFGASLQHTGASPPVEVALKQFLGVPDDYHFQANMVFGEPAQPFPDVPEKLPIDETLTVLK
ncbi:putative nitroreductase [Fusarium torreyae]|uniref:Nitroreductase n=1 Tax=Fusarium torreyae TaxID=1237075 RepID=A0A9W8VLU3_9HYPO|nr:putative nitroreductase [Fusarium torreyae]